MCTDHVVTTQIKIRTIPGTQQVPCAHCQSMSAPPQPEVLPVLITITTVPVLPVLELHINGIGQYVPFYGWLVSLNIIIWKILHAECSSNSFSWPCIVCMLIYGHTTIYIFILLLMDMCIVFRFGLL